jgi:hypothetical protein
MFQHINHFNIFPHLPSVAAVAELQAGFGAEDSRDVAAAAGDAAVAGYVDAGLCH